MTTGMGLPVDNYATHDLPLAAFLVACDHPVKLVGEPRRRTFIFPPAAAGDADRFYAGAQIPAIKYAHAMRDLKARLHTAG